MQSRREFLRLAGMSALAMAMPTGSRAGQSATAWPPYGNTLVIDGAGGSQLPWLDKDDPKVPEHLDMIRASGVGAAIVTVGPAGRFWLSDAAFELVLDRVKDWRSKIEAHPDYLSMVLNQSDLERMRHERLSGSIFTFQGTEPLGENLERIELFKGHGVRVIQLTHNRRNLVGDGCMEPGNAGLSNYGRQVVEELNSQRIVVDLAHGSQRTIAEGIQTSKEPVLISHAGCKALADLPRNVANEELRAMADKGGVIGIIFWPYLRTRGQPMASDVIRHIEHAIDVCGEDHVGIGTDIYIEPVEITPEFKESNRNQIATMIEHGIFQPDRSEDLLLFIPDLNQVNRFEKLAALLSDRGHGDDRIAKILGGNFARVLGEVWG